MVRMRENEARFVVDSSDVFDSLINGIYGLFKPFSNLGVRSQARANPRLHATFVTENSPVSKSPNTKHSTSESYF